MATAKERGHKDWGYGGVVKRDFKADKSDGEYGTVRDHGKRWYSRGVNSTKKKDTKRWCRGKINREHVWTLYKKYESIDWWAYRCVNCGKEPWGRPTHGILRKISYRSNDEYDYVPINENP